MKLLVTSSVQKKLSDHQEIRAFRSEVQSSIVRNTILKTTDFANPRPDDVKVSAFRLEQYLNACNPTCHG